MTIVRCGKCGYERRVHYGYCTWAGWPRHCGEVMRLVKVPKPEKIAALVEEVLDIGEYAHARDMHRLGDVKAEVGA